MAPGRVKWRAAVLASEKLSPSEHLQTRITSFLGAFRWEIGIRIGYGIHRRETNGRIV